MHSSILAWKIPWTEEPGGFQSMWSLSWPRLSMHAHMYDVTCDVRGLKDMLKKHGDGRFRTVPWGERSRMTLKSNSQCMSKENANYQGKEGREDIPNKE